MVKQSAFNGTLNENPYCFEPFGLNHLAIYLDSVQIPTKPLTPDFANNLYAEAYQTLFTGSGIHFANSGNTISYKDYKSGYTLFCFDLTPDMSCNESHWNLQKNGSLRAELGFASQLTQAIVVILYAEFSNMLEITKDRDIILDYSC